MSISSISNQGLSQSYRQLASGKRINSAADDAAGMAIAERLLKQSNSLDAATRNAGTFQDMTKVADGALGSIADNLGRIRELSVQAANGLYTDSDKRAIQSEIDQLKQQISDTAGQTQFNTKNLLDGSTGPMTAAISADGTGMEVEMPVSTLQMLGIADYDVTQDFDISAIDDALQMVNASRSELGATSNRLDYAMSTNSYSSLNTTSARSRIEDLDYPQAVSEQKKQDVLLQYSLMMQRKKMEDENGTMRRLFS